MPKNKRSESRKNLDKSQPFAVYFSRNKGLAIQFGPGNISGGIDTLKLISQHLTDDTASKKYLASIISSIEKQQNPEGRKLFSVRKEFSSEC